MRGVVALVSAADLVLVVLLAKEDEKIACSAGDARGAVVHGVDDVLVVDVVVFIMTSLASRNFASREVRSKQSLYAIRRNDNSP